MESIRNPVAMFVGTKDDVGDIYDARVMRWKINRSYDIYYEEL